MKFVKKLLPYLIVVGVSFLYLSFYSHYLFATNPANDEGTMVGAWRIMHSQMIYKDFFSVFFPGNFYLMAGLYKLFGYTIVVTNYIMIAAACVINLLLYHIARLVIKKWYAILAPLLFLTFGFTQWFTFNHYLTADIAVLLTLISLNRYMRTKRDTFLYIAGLLAGITTVMLQSTGVYTILILTPLIYFRNKPFSFKSVVKFAGAAFIPIALMIILLIINGAFIPFLKDQYILFVLYPRISTFYMGIFASIKYVFEPLRLLLIITTFLSLILLFKKKKASSQEQILFAGGIILFMNTLHRLALIIPTTTYINMELTIVFSVYLLSGMEDFMKKICWELIYKSIKRVFNVIAAVGIIAAFVFMYASVKKINKQAYHFELHNERLWSFNKADASTLVKFIDRANKIIDNDRYVLVYPFASMLYPLMDIVNPTSYDVIPSFGRSASAPESMLNEVISKLKSTHNKYIITYQWSYREILHLYQINHTAFKANRLESYIWKYYDPVLSLGEFTLRKFTTASSTETRNALVPAEFKARFAYVSPASSIKTQNILVLGSVKKTGIFYFYGGKAATLLSLLEDAKGPIRSAGLNAIIIIRSGKRIKVNFVKYIQTRDRQYNPVLHNYDIVYVPGGTSALDSRRNKKLMHNFLKGKGGQIFSPLLYINNILVK